MAKISARGATEFARFEGPKGTAVVTSDGRVLFKARGTAGYKLRARAVRGAGPEQLVGIARRLAGC